MSTICPVCGKDDVVQKVSSVVSNGISDGYYSRYSGRYSHLHETSATNLARQLVPPSPPDKRPILGHCINALMLVGFTALCLFIFLASISGFLEGPTDNTLISTSFVVTLASLVFTILTLNKIQVIIRQNKYEYPKRVEEWQRQMAKYDRLYFCHRDDVVFDMESRRFTAPKNLLWFLSQVDAD